MARCLLCRGVLEEEAAEHLLDFFIARQVPPGGALFDDLPFLIGDVVARAPLFNLADEPRHPLLIVGWPSQHAIENFFYLISGHGISIPHRLFAGTVRAVRTTPPHSPTAHHDPTARQDVRE